MKKFVTELIGSGLMLLLSVIARAGSATWDLNPGSGDWNTAANWTPMTVPNGSTDTATFALSNTTSVSISANTEVNGITFTAAATNPYTITASPGFTLTLTGAGITNNSGIAQNFVTGGEQFGQISFTNNATAGNSTIFTNNNGANNSEGGHTFFFNTSTAGSGTFINNSGTVTGLFQGFTEFFDTSTAANGTFTNNGSTISNTFDAGETVFNATSTAGSATINNNGAAASNAGGGETFFNATSTAGSATINNNGGTVSGAHGGITFFSLIGGTSTAGNGTFINNGATVSGAYGGATEFFSTSTAGSATLIANSGTGGGQGGAILFEEESTGSTSRIEVFGNGNLDISPHGSTGVTIGSIEGDGSAFLGANNLTVGSNNLSTTFSGVIQDGGQNGGVGGSLTKSGTGTLELTGANTYTGGTNINGGILKINGSITSNASVNHGGTLAGTGRVHGNVTNNGRVSPGGNALGPGTLTVDSYTQASNGRLLIDIAGPSTGEFSVLDVLGNANVNGILHPVLLNGFIPTVGESFTFMDYTALTGAFSRIQNQVFGHGMEHWLVTYQATDTILTAESGPRHPGVRDLGVTVVTIPDQGSTFLLLTSSLLGLMTYRHNAGHN
jgi:autotransporter-associated beta strand protein